jgi:hypothetical protein
MRARAHLAEERLPLGLCQRLGVCVSPGGKQLAAVGGRGIRRLVLPGRGWRRRGRRRAAIKRLAPACTHFSSHIYTHARAYTCTHKHTHCFLQNTQTCTHPIHITHSHSPKTSRHAAQQHQTQGSPHFVARSALYETLATTHAYTIGPSTGPRPASSAGEEQGPQGRGPLSSSSKNHKRQPASVAQSSIRGITQRGFKAVEQRSAAPAHACAGRPVPAPAPPPHLCP